MAVGITATANNSYHSPGYDLTVTGLTGSTSLTVSRIDLSGEFPETPVRGAENIPVSGSAFSVSDYEAPIGKVFTYAATTDRPVVVDLFDSTNTGGWGSADTGQVWTVEASPTAQFTTANPPGVGRIDVEARNARRMISLDVGSPNMDVSVTIAVTTLATGGSIQTGVFGRFLDVNNHYYAELLFETDQRVTLRVQKMVGGANTNLSFDVATGLTHTTGGQYRLRFFVSGSELRAKAWNLADPEPASWLYQTVDTSLTTGNRTGIHGILPTVNTNTLPLRLAYDDLTITPLNVSVTSPTVGPISTDPGTVWLKSVGQPALSRRVNMVDFSDISRPGRILGEYEVLGKSNKVVVTDVLGGREGSFTLVTFPVGGQWQSDSSTRDLMSLFQLGGTLLLQNAGVDVTGEEDLYLEVGSIDRKRVTVVGGELVHLHTVKFIEVDRPATSQESLTLRDWADVLSENATWAGVLANRTNWLDVLQRGSP